MLSISIQGERVSAEDVLRLTRQHVGSWPPGAWLAPAIFELVVRAAAERLHLRPVTDAELQQAVDAYRAMRALYGATETEQWLAAHYLTLEDLERGVETQLLYIRWAEQAVGSAVEAYFEEHRLDYERVALSLLVVREEALAHELRDQLEEGEAEFATLARAYSLDESAGAGGYLGWVFRGNLPPAVESAVYGTPVMATAGPVLHEDEYYLVRGEGFAPAELSDAVVVDIRETLMRPVVAAQLAEITVEVER